MSLCKHGRKEWKCVHCCREVAMAKIVDDLIPVSLSPEKQAELVKEPVIRRSPYDDLAKILYKFMGQRPSRYEVESFIHAEWNDDFNGCKLYAADPSLIQFVWGTGRQEYTKLMSYHELRQRFAKHLAKLTREGACGGSSVIHPTITPKFVETLHVQPTLKQLADARVVDLGAGDVASNPTIYIDKACELVIGGERYMVRFEGKKGHIIPC